MGLIAALRQRLARHFVDRLRFAARGPNVVLHNGSVFHPAERIDFGEDIYIGPEARLHADGGLTIGDHTIFGPAVTIYTSNHVVEGADYLPYGPRSERAPVEIGPNVWVGGHAVILPGVSIGEGAVIAAGAVVARDVPPLALAAGNPARVVRYRDPEHYARLKREGRFYMSAKRLRPLEVDWVERTKPPRMMEHTPEAERQRAELGLGDRPPDG